MIWPLWDYWGMMAGIIPQFRYTVQWITSHSR